MRLDGEYAWIETQRQSACGGCSARNGCGTGVLSRVLGRKNTRVRALNRAGAGVGDRVTVAVREGLLVKGSVVVYTIPLVAMLGLSILGRTLGATPEQAEHLSILAGLAGLGLGFLWVWYHTRQLSADSRYQPVVVSRRTGL